jgi:hypothetical protein
LITKIYRVLKKLISPKINEPIKKWATELNNTFSKEEVQIVKKYMKIWLPSLAIKEMQIKTTLRFHLTSVSGSCYLRYKTLRHFSRKQLFTVPAQTQQTRVQRLSSENKGVSSYIPLQTGCRNKKQGLIHKWLYLIL